MDRQVDDVAGLVLKRLISSLLVDWWIGSEVARTNSWIGSPQPHQQRIKLVLAASRGRRLNSVTSSQPREALSLSCRHAADTCTQFVTADGISTVLGYTKPPIWAVCWPPAPPRKFCGPPGARPASGVTTSGGGCLGPACERRGGANTLNPRILVRLISNPPIRIY